MSNGAELTPHDRALTALRRKGNPFRQQFARNADDPVCSLYHVDDLFLAERRIVQALVESYRGRAERPTCVLPILGPRGAGKTHLLHCLKHGPGVAPEMFITPGTFRIDAGGNDSSFLEYLLYQFINVLLAGGEQRGARPLDYVGEQLTRQVLTEVISRREANHRLELLRSARWKRWGWKLGLGQNDALILIDSFVEALRHSAHPSRQLAEDAGMDLERLIQATDQFLELYESRDLTGQFRRKLTSHFLRACLLGDDGPLADFLTDGFVEVSFLARPSRPQLTLSLLQSLTKVIVGAGIPVAVAFDQLEELLYGQTDDEVRRSSDGFFGGLVQLMSQVPGLCVLLFVEEGLWNRIVPPLPSHILDRIHEPIHVEDHGTVRSVRLSTPTAEQLTKVVSRRIRHTLQSANVPDTIEPTFPFGEAFLKRLAQKESVLRLMLQGCCNRLDEILELPAENALQHLSTDAQQTASESVTPITVEPEPVAVSAEGGEPEFRDRWEHELRAAHRKLKPVGSLSAAAEELRGGLVRWLHFCKSLGVELGDWRMAGIDDHVQVGDHPTYGTLTIIHWSNAQSETRRVGIGMWLGRGVGKPRDLETKLQVFAVQPALVDHLILFRPADDIRMSGKTKTAWDQAVQAAASLRLEAVELDVFSKLFAFPRWIRQVHEVFGQDVPEWVYALLAEETQSILLRLALPDELGSEETTPQAA